MPYIMQLFDRRFTDVEKAECALLIYRLLKPNQILREGSIRLVDAVMDEENAFLKETALLLT